MALLDECCRGWPKEGPNFGPRLGPEPGLEPPPEPGLPSEAEPLDCISPRTWLDGPAMTCETPVVRLSTSLSPRMTSWPCLTPTLPCSVTVLAFLSHMVCSPV